MDTFTALMTATLALIVARFFWREFLVVCAVLVLMISCSRADTLEVALVSDGTVPVESMLDAAAEADRIYAQLGVHVIVKSTEVRDNVPTHTNPDVLLRDFRAQISNGTAGPDAVVLFTARNLSVGSRHYAGIATTGPACTAWQVGIVSTNPAGGAAYQTMAHEVGHTLGLDHDDAPGYVMGPDERGGETFSPQSIAQFKGQFRDCLADPVTVASTPAKAVQSAPAKSKGGGGEMSEMLLVFLSIAAAVREYFRGMVARESADHWARKYRKLRQELTESSTETLQVQ